MFKDMSFFKEDEKGQFRLVKNKSNNTVELIGVIMSDSEIEKQANKDIIKKAKGDVFIAGIGIGLIILPIQEKKDVTSITILEKYPDVVKLVANQLPLNKKVNIIIGDIFNYKPDKKYDTMYIDIFGEYTPQLNKWFIMNFSHYLKEGGYINGFCVKEK